MAGRMKWEMRVYADMSNTNELLNRINSSYAKLSKGQKRLSAYITDNYDKAAFWTAEKLGEEVGVSESTVVRFAIRLGYKGYPEFQKALGELVRTKLNTAQRVEAACGRMPESQVLSSVLREDMEKIQTTLDTIDETAFEAAVDTILHARRCMLSVSGAVSRWRRSDLLFEPGHRRCAVHPHQQRQ